MAYYGGWAPYVPVAKRRHQALKKMSQLRTMGLDIQPIEIEGRKITTTFWGQAWCDHLESLGDFANRLPRGRTYVRNGSVCHLAIARGQITAMVSGSSLYNIKIQIDTLPKKRWSTVKAQCAGQIGSLLELLQGRLSHQVMGVVTNAHGGLFPLPQEIHLNCSCPDWAIMCKHVAAALYGVGARLDEQPDLLFLLRGVAHEELISADTEDAVTRATRRSVKRRTLAIADLGDVFGIELDAASAPNGDTECSDLPASGTRNSSARKRKAARKKKSRPVAIRRKKSKAAKSPEKKTSAAARSTKKKASKKKSPNKNASKKTSPNKKVTATKSKAAKKKAVSQTLKNSSSKKTAKKSTKKKTKKAITARKPKTKPPARVVKKSATKKQAVQNRLPVVKKAATRKKTASKNVTNGSKESRLSKKRTAKK